MRIFTREQWEQMPDEKKGTISSVFDARGHVSRWEGLRTLEWRKRRLVEGIDFRINGLPRAQPQEFSLI